MFSKSRTRIALLALGTVVAWMLFYIEGFAGFAPAWPWKQHVQLQQPLIGIADLRLSSFQHGVLLTGLSDAIDVRITGLDRHTHLYSYNRTLQIDLLAENAPPLLNLQLSADKQKIRSALERQTGQGRGRDIFGDRTRVPVSHIITEQHGQLRVSARFMGLVTEQHCSAQGQCLIIFGSSRYGKDAVFYSDNGGQNWRWLPQWKQPEADESYKILGVAGAQSVLVVQQGKLYRSDSLGQHWQPVLDLAPMLAEKGIDSSLYTPHWRYNGQHNVVIWHQFNTNESDDLPHFLLTDFNLEASRIQSNQWGEGSIVAGESTPQGDFYFVLAHLPRQRYSLNLLQPDGTLAPLLETGKKRLGKLYLGNKLFMLAKGFNDPEHMTVSTDDGQSWFRMKKLPDQYDETLLFDSWHNRLFRFTDRAYSNSGAGLAYETAEIK